jgi:hypothetical protein
MQKNQIADHALTLHIKSGNDGAAPYLRLVVDAPTIQSIEGSAVFTITLSVMSGSNDSKPDNKSQRDLPGKRAQQPPRPTPLFLTREPHPFPLPSRFRNWYLCQRDGAEWSLEVGDPTRKDSCPICSEEVSAIAIIRLPLDTGKETQGASESELTVCRSASSGARSPN